MSEKFEQLKMHLGRVVDLQRSAAVLSWDQETYMPAGGAAARAEQLSTLSGLAHQYFVDETVGALLEDLSTELDDEYESDLTSIVRVQQRDYLKLVKVPGDLVMKIAKARALSQHAWVEARENNDFALFQPHLEEIVELRKQYAEALGSPTDNIYDALVNDYDPGLTQAYIDGVFRALKPRLVALVEQVTAAQQVDDSMLKLTYEKQAQLDFSMRVAEGIGYDTNRGRLDISAHPFSTSFDTGDVRITTRVYEDFMPTCLMGVLHETGHAMYEQNINPDLRRTGLDSGTSMSLHESQSRFYENVIGRSRAFWSHWYPQLQEAFPAQLGSVDQEAFYKAMNKSEPSLIRVEADELTYGLHIMLRFEIENDLINDRIAVADLPDVWNSKMKEYLGQTPPNDSQGVLQDIHWSMGAFGYFPDYLLGSIFSVQLWEALQESIPDATGQVAQGDLSTINAWMNSHIHYHGSKFTFPEVAERVTGKPLQWEPYMHYLETKFSDVYGL